MVQEILQAEDWKNQKSLFEFMQTCNSKLHCNWDDFTCKSLTIFMLRHHSKATLINTFKF